jgi:hypothetical protein
LAKKLVDDLERVRSETESMIAARVKAEQAQQKAVAAELAAKEALAGAEQRLKEAASGGATEMVSGTGAASLLGHTVRQVVGLCLVVGLLLATQMVPTGSDEALQRGPAVAAAWVAYAFTMVAACLYA